MIRNLAPFHYFHRFSRRIRDRSSHGVVFSLRLEDWFCAIISHVHSVCASGTICFGLRKNCMSLLAYFSRESERDFRNMQWKSLNNFTTYKYNFYTPYYIFIQINSNNCNFFYFLKTKILLQEFIKKKEVIIFKLFLNLNKKI